jgi:hypothetical protein
VRPGQTAAIGINVTDGHDRYALSLSKLGVGGVNNTNNHLVYQLDPNWIDNSTFYTTPVLTVNQPFTYNLGVKTNAPADFYLLNMDLAGLSDPVTNHWDQFEQFYLQVLSTSPPAPQQVAGVGQERLACRSKCELRFVAIEQLDSQLFFQISQLSAHCSWEIRNRAEARLTFNSSATVTKFRRCRNSMPQRYD